MSQSRLKRIFSKRTQKLFYPTVLFNNVPVQPNTVQKHLGVYLDEKRNFNTHITEKIGKASKQVQYNAALAITGTIKCT